MTLGDKQRLFARMTIKLYQFIIDNGYEFTYGDGFRDPRLHGLMGVKQGYGRSRSNHKVKLAVDINLFKDEEYLTSTDDHRVIGLYWESIGGSWGGRFDDGNHYSLEHNGRR